MSNYVLTSSVGPNPDSVAVQDTTPQNPLGALTQIGDQVYRYVQHSTGSGGVASAAGGAAYWKTLTIGATIGVAPTYLVTSDQSDAYGGATGFGSVAGVYKGVVTTLKYTWIAVGGAHQCLVAAGVVAGDGIMGSATDGVFARKAMGVAATDPVYGVALEARSATVANSALCLLNNTLAW